MKKFFTVLLCYCLAFQPAFAALNDVEKAQSGQTQLLPNPGFENGLSSITATDLTDVAHVTSGTNLLDGKGSITWNSDGASQTLTFCATVPEGYEGRNGAAGFKMILTPSGTATHTIKITDGTNDLVSAETITSSTSPQSAIRNFIFSTTGTACVVLTSVAADEPLIAIDNGFMGLASDYNVSSVSQATFVGGMENAGASTCTYSENTSTGLSDFDDLGTGTSCAAWTVVSNGPGTISAQATNDHRLVYTNMPPGNYIFRLAGTFGKGAAAGGCMMQLSDGTTSYQPHYQASGDAVATYTGAFEYSVTVTSGLSRTYKLQASDNHASNCEWYNAANHPASWKVYRFPTSSEQAYTPDTTAWKVDANISGANISLGSSAQTAYVAPNNASLTLTQNTGSASVGISCSSTNDNSVGSTTCSAGSEEPGIVVNVPRAGQIEVCYDFTHLVSHSTTSTIYATFQAVRTANGSQTIAEEGKSRIYSGASTSAAGFTHLLPHKVCGQFNITAAAKHTFRLMYEMPAATITTHTIVADADANNGQRDIHVTARYVDQSIPAPVLTNMVTTPSSGGVRICSGQASMPSTITSSSGSCASSLTGGATGFATVNFASGTFSAVPHCTVSIIAGSGGYSRNCGVNSTPTTSALVVGCGRPLTETGENHAFSFHCVGAR